MSLLCVGSVAYDVIELPGREPVAVLGGSATWFCTAAGMFSRPQLVGVVGDDFLETDVEFLRSRGVDVSGLARLPGRTFQWHGRYHDDLIRRDTLKTELGVFAEFSPVIPPEWRRPGILFLGNIKPDLQALVLAQCRDAGFVALDTIALWIDAFRGPLTRLLPRIDLLFLNDDEVRQLSGETNVITAARKVLGMGARAVVVKRGEHGAMLFSPDGDALFPAVPVEAVVDPTGAGDCFAGGALGYLDLVKDTSPETVRHALVVGTIAASFCVEGFGPRAFEKVAPSRVQERLAKYLNAVRFDADRVLADLSIG